MDQQFELLNPEFVTRVVGARGKRGVDGYLGIVVDSLEPGRIERAPGDWGVLPVVAIFSGCFLVSKLPGSQIPFLFSS